MPMVFTDAEKSDHPIIFVNDAFLELTGYDRDEVLAQSFNFLLARPDQPRRSRRDRGGVRRQGRRLRGEPL